MKEKNDKERSQRGRRLREKVDGPVIMALYSKMATKELARLLGLTVKQIENFVYRHNLSSWARKVRSLLSAENSANGKKGGRPRKK